MSSIRHALLSLLAREPLSGYDIKQQMNSRLSPFWKEGSHQVYPELSKMEKEGLIRLHGIEQNTYRPARKLYEITESGQKAVMEWAVEPTTEVGDNRDDFLLKIYDSWLVEPEKMKQQIVSVRGLHENKLAAYLDKIEQLTKLIEPANSRDPLISTISVIEFAVRYERLYIDWCSDLLSKL